MRTATAVLALLAVELVPDRLLEFLLIIDTMYGLVHVLKVGGGIIKKLDLEWSQILIRYRLLKDGK